jgi:outer membrane protein assembly factor BamD
VVLPLTLYALSGCGSPPPRSALNYTEEAHRAYDKALAEFEAHNWLESQALFREVKKNYPYAKYARLAELRIADADFEQEKFTEAVRGYKQFIHDHRADTDEVGYARSKIAEAQYREIGDSPLLPSTDERDQAAVLEAYRELRSYLLDYPDAKEAERTKKLLSEVTARLVRHELHVARFYLDRDNLEAASMRIQYALRNYAPAYAVVSASENAKGERGEGAPLVQSGLEPEALMLLGEVYLKMRRYAEARDAFVTILRDYAVSPLANQARAYVQYLKDRGA